MAARLLSAADRIRTEFASPVVAQVHVEHVVLVGDLPGSRSNALTFTVE
ncbi:MAG: hypothetical protein ACXWLF_03620 [Myxococcaceae bacterium]